MRGILTYHSIDDSGSVISIRPEVFRRQADWLASGSLRVLPLDEIGDAPLDADAVALTFDDGFENFGSVAWPELRRRGLPATLFVVTERVGRTNAWEDGNGKGIPELPLLDWDDLGRLADEGVMLGSHTRTHPDLSRLDGRRLEDEIAGSAERIQGNTGVHPSAFAYPFGRSPLAAIDTVRQVYRHACTTELRFIGPSESPHLLPRMDMYYFRQPGRLEGWGTPRFRRRVSVRHRFRRLRARVGEIGSGR